MATSTELPRERLQRFGPDVMLDIELVALILGKSSTALASKVIAQFHDLRRLAGAGVGELTAVRGLGQAQACRLKAALALGARLASRPFERGDPFTTPDEVFERVGRRLLLLEREVFVCLALDSRNRVLTEVQLATGGACSVEIIPRDVFKTLVREGAVNVVFVHNHPSGDPSPSPADVEMTAHLRNAGNVVGVRVLDHVIVAAGGFRARSKDWTP